MKKLKNILALACAAVVLCSCSDLFERKPDGMLPGDDNFTERANVYASFNGLLGALQDASDDLVLLSELKGDLMSPTDQAPDSYWQIFRNLPIENNKEASPMPFYRIVMSSNDFLRNAVAYQHKNPDVIPANTYRQMIAGAVTMRAWAYLQIGKLYGSAAYYDYAFTGEVDLSKMSVLELEDLVPELIYFMNTGVDNINGMRRVDLDLMFGMDGTIWRRLAVLPDALMCELYLWNGNFEAAAKAGINLITGQGLLDAGNDQNLTCSNMFGGPAGGTRQWHTLWSEAPVAAHTNEALTVVLFNYAQRQTNRLHELFSATPPNLYYFKPTENLISKYQGRDYRLTQAVIADPRGEGVTYGTEMGESVIYKYHCKGRLAYLQEAPIYIYRAAEIHLMIAEALVGIGAFDAAEKILNVGFSPSWVNGNTFNAPFDAPIYSYQKLRRGIGVRGRVEIPVIRTAERFLEGYTEGTPEYTDRYRFVLDSIIVEETARELAFEGKRWFALMRVGLNLDNNDFVAKMVSKKFASEAEGTEYYNSMLDRSNWFIQYDLKLDKE